MSKNLIKTHIFCFNRKDNSGEGLTLTTEIYDNGEKEIFYNQELTLQSHCNCASFNLCGATFTPNLLRKLADELEKIEIDYKNGK